MSKKANIKITFPDAPPKKQIKMMKDWVDIVQNFEKLTGKEGTTDLKPIYEQIKKLEASL